MCSRIDLDLPLPPSVNGLFADGGRCGGGRIKSRRYKAWLKQAGLEIIAARPALSGRGLVSRPYGARVRWPSAARFDCDNGIKALLDLLVTMRITPDDGLCRHLSVGYCLSLPPGRCAVRVWTLRP